MSGNDERLGPAGIRYRDLVVRLATDLDRAQQQVLATAALAVGVPPVMPLEWPYQSTSETFTAWWHKVTRAALERVVSAAVPRAFEASRATCPWCGEGATHAGFSLPGGLERHWRGTTMGRQHGRQCGVGRAAAYVLARIVERERATGPVSEPQQKSDKLKGEVGLAGDVKLTAPHIIGHK